MNIALTHFRVGETDGVSLEMDKWKTVLEEMGHNVCYIAGTQGTTFAHIVEEMDYRGEHDGFINKECFEKAEKLTQEGLKVEIGKLVKSIEDKFVKIIEDNSIDMLIPNNLLSIGRSPHIAMAIINAVKRTGTKVIGHHHDFYWERDYFSNPQNEYAKELLDHCFPPTELNDMEHVVINTLAKHDLLVKKGRQSTVIPNVFDFDGDLWKEDDYNSTYKSDLGLTDNDIVFLQGTRVTNRKAIELAIDVVDVLNSREYRKKMIGKTLYNGKVFNADTKIKLVLVGLHEGGYNYEKKLIGYAKEKNVDMIVCPERVDHSRKTADDGSKVYSLWDAYVHCDVITYPSIYEGWGNQFLEGLFAKKPILVFEYSVFESDIKSFGFDYISLGNEYKTKDNGLVYVEKSVLKSAADDLIAYLTDGAKYDASVEHNFEKGRKSFSLTALRALLNKLKTIN